MLIDGYEVRFLLLPVLQMERWRPTHDANISLAGISYYSDMTIDTNAELKLGQLIVFKYNKKTIHATPMAKIGTLYQCAVDTMYHNE